MQSADREILLQQLGRPLHEAVEVVVRCVGGHPCTVRSYPLRRRRGGVEPFPTLYWLSCPNLSRQLSHLEREGVISVIERELADSQAMRDMLMAQQQQYIDTRWQLISEEDRQLIASRGWEQNLRQRGIGGASNLGAVKCLHAHYAHHLVDGNVIGQWIDSQYKLKACTGTSMKT